jgi:hypothetical protein
VMGFLTYGLMYPGGNRVKWSIVIVGDEGIGKTYMVNRYMDIFPEGTAAWHQEHQVFSDKFVNPNMQYNVVMAVEEYNHTKVSQETVKTMITENKANVNVKYLDPKMSDKYGIIILITNKEDCNFGDRSRRFFVIKANSQLKKNTAFWSWLDAVYRTRDYTARECMMYKFCQEKYLKRGFNTEKCIVTSTLINMQQQHLNSVQAWWYKALEQGHVTHYSGFQHVTAEKQEELKDECILLFPAHIETMIIEELRGKSDEAFQCYDELTKTVAEAENHSLYSSFNRFSLKDDMYKAYREFCKDNNKDRQTEAEVNWYNELKKIVPLENRSMQVPLGLNQMRTKTFVMTPHLEVCRKYFLHYMGWNDGVFYSDADNPIRKYLGGDGEETVLRIIKTLN